MTDDGAITSTVATSIASMIARESSASSSSRPSPDRTLSMRAPRLGDHPDLLAVELALDDADDGVEQHPRLGVDRRHRLRGRPQAGQRLVEVEQAAQLPVLVRRAVAPAGRRGPIRRAGPTPARRDGARTRRATRACARRAAPPGCATTRPSRPRARGCGRAPAGRPVPASCREPRRRRRSRRTRGSRPSAAPRSPRPGGPSAWRCPRRWRAGPRVGPRCPTPVLADARTRLIDPSPLLPLPATSQSRARYALATQAWRSSGHVFTDSDSRVT